MKMSKQNRTAARAMGSRASRQQRTPVQYIALVTGNQLMCAYDHARYAATRVRRKRHATRPLARPRDEKICQSGLRRRV